MKKPNLFIIGEPKSGTTSIYHYLKDHPDIDMSSYKEPKFFATDLRKESDFFHGKRIYFPIRTVEDYLKLFKDFDSRKIVGEVSPQYIFSKEAAKNISKYNQNAKIVVLFREPVGFLFSLFREWKANLFEDSEDFETALALEAERREGRSIPTRVVAPSYLYYSEWVKYTDQIKRFSKYFNKNQIKIIIFDDLKNKPIETYEELIKFLNLKPDNSFQPKAYNVSHQVRFQPIVKMIRSPIMINIAHRFIPKRYVGRVDIFYKKAFFKKTERPLLKGDLREKLMKQYKDEVIKLGKFLKRNLPEEWGYSIF